MANTYLLRTLTSTGNRKLWTWSAWIKKAIPDGTEMGLFGLYEDGANYFRIRYKSDQRLGIDNVEGNTTNMSLILGTEHRDVSGWYHLVVKYDSAQSTASNRVKIYVNGVLQTVFQSSTYPSQNANTYFPVNALPLNVGRTTNNKYFDGSMSHIHFTDGYAYDASAFGSTDSTTGEWKINTSPSVTYGTNGFFILKDNGAKTDQSGNGNNFSEEGTPGIVSNTQDNPSNVFATWNPLIGRHTNGTNLVPTLSNGNTTSFSDGSTWQVGLSTLATSSGKYYTEVKWISDSNTRYSEIGLYEVDAFAQKITGYPYMPDMANCYGLRDSDGKIRTGGSATSYGVSYGPSNIISVAMDLDNNKLYYAKDGVWMNSANPSSGTGGFSIIANKTYAFGLQQYAVGNITFSTNFGNGYFGTTAVSSAGSNASGNGIFEYDVPTGFTALSTKGLNI